MPTGNQIKKTEEIYIQSEPNPDWMGKDEEGRLRVEERMMPESKSLDDVTEGGESVKSEEVQRREDSDDEAVLVARGRGGWGRLP